MLVVVAGEDIEGRAETGVLGELRDEDLIVDHVPRECAEDVAVAHVGVQFHVAHRRVAPSRTDAGGGHELLRVPVGGEEAPQHLRREVLRPESCVPSSPHVALRLEVVPELSRYEVRAQRRAKVEHAGVPHVNDVHNGGRHLTCGAAVHEDPADLGRRHQAIEVRVGLHEVPPELVQVARLDQDRHEQHGQHVAEQPALDVSGGVGGADIGRYVLATPLSGLKTHDALQPRVLQRAGRRRAVARLLQQVLDEAAAHRAAVGPGIAAPTSAGEEAPVQPGPGALLVVGRAAHEQCVRYGADAPHVRVPARGSPEAREQLRCRVGARALLRDSGLGI
mmetsp:Transcript_111243/g.314888  ORF Transcript_111243/g.314888 Transcript_111243/m.314888 type:complete len:335 (-) Transcript_111243:591-1595(-)